ncbi:MAG: sensor histidine kinase N-terminal domain-containing protein [Xenophilus sp.]
MRISAPVDKAAAHDAPQGERQEPAAETPPTLRSRVLRHVMLPLAFTWFVGTLVAMWVANHFTEQAFDRAMLDDASALASSLRTGDDGRAALSLSPGEVTAVLFDQAETVRFAVLRSADGERIAGQADLHAPSGAADADSRIGNIRYRGQPLRAVSLRRVVDGTAYDVVVAETTHTRSALLGRLLLFATLPQTALMLLLALWLWHGVARDLLPLDELRRALRARSPGDLAPVPVARTTLELRHLGDAMNALFARLDRSARAQREFAGSVAHELRTPLAGIRALANYGLTHGDPAVWKEQLHRIVASESRASHLVDQLLALALADEADTVLQRERIALDELVRRTVLRHLARADACGVDLGARGLDAPGSDAPHWTVLANTALVEGILDNLIDNALRYGGRTITLELSLEADGRRVLSAVDDGPGIPEALRQNLMQRWSQGADGRRLGQGAGLGLAIVARYAQLLGAQLRLVPASTKGGLRVSVAFAA